MHVILLGPTLVIFFSLKSDSPAAGVGQNKLSYPGQMGNFQPSGLTCSVAKLRV